MEVRLLTYSDSFHYLFGKINKGTQAEPKFEYPLLNSVRGTSSLDAWNSMRKDIYAACRLQACGTAVNNNYVFARKYAMNKTMQPLTDKLSSQIAPWKTDPFPPKGRLVLPLEYRRNVMAVGYVNGKPTAFFLVNDASDIYLDVICGQPGVVMLSALFAWAGKRTIRLSSLMNVIGYYPKFGFSFGECGDTSNIKDVIASYNLKRDAFDDKNNLSPSALAVLHILRSHHLIHPNTPACDTMSDAEFAKNNCFTNGVRMTRCAQSTPRRSPPRAPRIVIPPQKSLRRSTRSTYVPVAKRTRAQTKKLFAR